jgi:hypothetical protein
MRKTFRPVAFLMAAMGASLLFGCGKDGAQGPLGEQGL